MDNAMMGRKKKPGGDPGKVPAPELTVKIRGAVRDGVEAFVRDFPAFSASAYVALATQEKLIADGYMVRPKRPADSDESQAD